MKVSQSNEIAFQLITSVADNIATSPTLTNFIDEVWYLFAYPDAVKQGVDAPFINNVVAATGGNSQVVTVFAAQRMVGAPLILQQGVWVLARIPTVVGNAGPILDMNLVNDGFTRFIYDVTSNVKIYSRFQQTSQLRIILNGVVIFDGNPIPGVLTPLIPIKDNTNAYNPQGIHFDGSTGLVTTRPLNTDNTGVISFAGWFNIDPSVTGSLQFSQGKGNNRLFNSATITSGVWFHMMGTADAAANLVGLLVNGLPASGKPSNVGNVFTSVPTNGTNLYIGTDTQGNFFKGDIADLSIWFDFSFFDNGVIIDKNIGRVALIKRELSGVVTMEPISTTATLFGFNNLPQLGPGTGQVLTLTQPDIFLSGPVTGTAGTAFTPHTLWGTVVQTITPLSPLSGAITNSSTNPGRITITPT